MSNGFFVEHPLSALTDAIFYITTSRVKAQVSSLSEINLRQQLSKFSAEGRDILYKQCKRDKGRKDLKIIKILEKHFSEDCI